MIKGNGRKNGFDKPLADRGAHPAGSPIINMVDDFDWHQQRQIFEGREKHVMCMEICKRNKENLRRIVEQGPSEGDAELIKALAAFALWELREQHYMRRMYLDE